MTRRFGPADRVTAVRAVLVGWVTVLVAQSLAGAHHTATLVVVSAVALVLDLVDGYVARRTHTESAFGARFDMEVDAFLIAVLSIHVAGAFGWWVLLIGAMRYLYVAAGWMWRWLRLPLPPRRSAKVIAAVQGVTLVVAASRLLPDGLVRWALVVALVLLIESFAQDCWAQWRRRREVPRDELASARRVTATVVGLALTGLLLLRVVGLGFEAVLNREFHLLGDLPNIRKGFEVIRDTESPAAAVLAIGIVGVGVGATLWLLTWAALRVIAMVRSRRRPTFRAVAAASILVMATVAANPIGLIPATVKQIRADERARTDFSDVLHTDAYAGRSGKQLVGALVGKDVLLIWFESYGRTALEGPVSPGVRAVLAQGDRQLAAAGYSTRSAFLTSPVVGAGSWLAHGSTQSGVWTDTEQRYSQLLASHRLSLTSAFERGGWRTVFVVPANTLDWPEGARYYGFDKLYDSRNVGYRGPKFGYASMPDQYTLEHFRRTELAKWDRRPVFAELDLVSSHYRWGLLPDLISWKQVGDGSVFDGMPERSGSAVDGHRDPTMSSRYYGRSVEYTWRTIISFLTTYPDPNRVVIIAGDHQPHPFVGGVGANRDAPVTVIAQDPDVIRRISGWHWQPSLRPKPDAPVWRMDAFRNRFFTAYGTGGWLPTKR